MCQFQSIWSSGQGNPALKSLNGTYYHNETLVLILINGNKNIEIRILGYLFLCGIIPLIYSIDMAQVINANQYRFVVYELALNSFQMLRYSCVSISVDLGTVFSLNFTSDRTRFPLEWSQGTNLTINNTGQILHCLVITSWVIIFFFLKITFTKH